MSSLAFDEMVGDTLAQVNVVREAFGYDPLYELPDAKRGNSQDCLYFRGLKDIGCRGVGSSAMEFSSERQAQVVAELWGTTASGRSVHSPSGIKRVINAFDNGRGTQHYDV